MVRRFKATFEAGDTSEFDGIGSGSPTVSMTKAYAGTYSLTGYSQIYKDFSSSSWPVTIGMRLLIDTFPFTGNRSIIELYSGPYTGLLGGIHIRQQAVQTLALLAADGSTLGESGIVAYNDGVWHLLEFIYTPSATGTVTAKLDGTTFATSANTSHSPVSWSRLSIGTLPANSQTLWIDDVTVDENRGGSLALSGVG